ncbi:class I SAM-dependent methyltransferase [Herbidospora mongoliensis]|uniref:class I SAM-dependent methyltransferase n=1 Tax=Herbidospora mongoliensis TaxID=688067 RepID=UPI00082AD240|nr:class I SAM-dependent methyltransferase [Herbidospora mongoliensis]
MTLSRDHARHWLDRWDRQQEGYMPSREARFDTLVDAVVETAGRSDPLVLDLGCGPGSLGARLKERLPAATVVGFDTDPLLMALGEAAYDGIRFVDADLRTEGWSAAAGLPRPADAAVSTTALHWLPEEPLTALYRELSTVLRPGGVFLNGDHLGAPADTRLAALERALAVRATDRRFPAGRPEDWASWWAAVEADPVLTALHADREKRREMAAHHGFESLHLDIHVTALDKAGFTEIGTLWQEGDDRLLCAFLPE